MTKLDSKNYSKSLILERKKEVKNNLFKTYLRVSASSQ